MNFEHTQVFNFEGALRGMRNPMNSWAKSDSYTWADCDMDEAYYDETIYDLGRKYFDNIMEGDDNVIDEAIGNKQDYLMDQASLGTIWGEHARVRHVIGPNDMKLARRLIEAGGEHRKFLRQIFVSVDITAPLYWWKEFDTYKVGTTANSTSTMHKLASTPITLDCFEIDDFEDIVFDAEYGSHDNLIFEYTTKEMADGIIKVLETLRQKYNETKDKRYWKELIRWLPNGWLQTRTITMNYENLRNMYHQRKNHKLTEWHSFCHWVEECLPYAKEFIIE
jgi:hypothetical protein